MESMKALTMDYESTCAFIDKCDEHMFKVKNWALITTSAVIAFSISSGKDLVVFSNLLLIPAFLYMELIYKSFQESTIEHATDLAKRIDRSLSAGSDAGVLEGYQFGFGRKLLYPSLQQCASILVNPARRHILNFYVLIFMFSIGAYLLGRYAA